MNGPKKEQDPIEIDEALTDRWDREWVKYLLESNSLDIKKCAISL